MIIIRLHRVLERQWGIPLFNSLNILDLLSIRVAEFVERCLLGFLQVRLFFLARP